MVSLAVIISLAALSLIALTYVVYPVWQLIFPGKPMDFTGEFTPPLVSVVFAAYNESSIIEAKIRSIYNTNYPIDKLSVWIGSDLSNDGTDEIIRNLQSEFPQLNLHVNDNRSGKSATINSLIEQTTAEVIIATDANILFKETTIEELVRPIALQKATAVAGTLAYEAGGVINSTATNEKVYLSLENAIRRAESRKHGICFGMEGGLYSMRKSFWKPIPPNTFMEDFFQTVQLIARDQKVLFNEAAIGLEDVSTSLREEYKRKIRISIGNWQNLIRFYPLLFKHPYPFGILFLMHKVLRWLTPHLYLIALIAGLFTSQWLIISIVLIGLPVSQFILMSFGLATPLAYFYVMNTALFVGFLRYLKGVKSSVWQPTKRNQHES
ncbi:MAG: Beta-monoglucosyldiacylglycerol synthase [Flavobacteriales bacterium UBA4585]|jgi:cellulose synthase/poly-beta-1,6-N-acetylglucosamine synthase-like glycosyltransferase|nr:MAG: Beta-monoglucosyldiacylglycerol synthase [Flavobacteriales bacterium UBA4585]|tara:strand:+ start:6999 stop:8141 length:1143 start_codon:yes stop_codon:yes gene_type:complete